MQAADTNQDGRINFNEFVPIGLALMAATHSQEFRDKVVKECQDKTAQFSQLFEQDPNPDPNPNPNPNPNTNPKSLNLTPKP